MRVVLQGSYFSHNFGDVLLLSLYTKWIKEAFKNCQVVLPQAKADMVAAIGADRRGLPELLRARGILYSGGGYFGEPPGSPGELRRWSIRNFYRHVPSGGALTLLGRPTAVIGVGAGPLSNPVFRSAVRKLIDRAMIVAVRDEESKNFLRGIGVSRSDIEVTADATLCLSADDIPEQYLTEVRNAFPCRGDTMIGVHLPAGRSFADRVELIVDGIQEVMNKYRDIEVVVISDNSSNDPQLLAGRLAVRYPNRVHMAPYQDPWKLLALISQLRMVVTTKLHVGIVATAVGTLPLSFAQHHKTQRFFRQIGASELYTPLNSVSRERVADQFDMALGTILGDNYTYKLPRQIRESARRNQELVQRFIRNVLGNIS